VHAGFSQVVAMLMTGSPLSSAHLMTVSNAYLNIAARHAAARACPLTQSPSVPTVLLGPELIPWQGSPNTPPRFIKYLYGVFASLSDISNTTHPTCRLSVIRESRALSFR
jgi:hypothetical protein